MLYGFRARELPQIPGNVLLVTGAVLVVLAVPSKIPARARAALLVAGAAGLITLALALPPALIGMVGLAIGLVSGVPQLLVSLRRRSASGSDDRSYDSAVSVLAWWLRVACQTCWLIYALMLGDDVVAVSAAVLLTTAALVLAVESSARRPYRREPALAAAH